MPHQGISKEIIQLMHDQGYYRQIELAQAANMTPQAISNLIQHGVDKHPRNAERLAEFFGVNVNDLKPERKKSEPKQKPAKDSYLTEGRSMPGLRQESRRTYIDEMKDENRRLRQGDLAIYAGCSLPLEFDIDLEKLRLTIADALKEGASFHYICPDDAFITKLIPLPEADASAFRQIKSQIHSPTTFAESMEAFRESLGRKHGVTPAVLESRLSLHSSADPLLLNPLYSIHSYIPGQVEAGESRVYLSIKEGSPGSPIIAPNWFHPEIRQAGFLLDRLRKEIKLKTE